MLPKNIEDGEEVCGICLEEVEGEKRINCNKCNNLFCRTCVLYWKINQNICPFKCSEPWDITLPLLPDKSISKEEKEEWDGFIKCPKCSRLGCLMCRNISCRKKIEFTPYDGYISSFKCSGAECQFNVLILFKGICAHCPETPLYYLFCNKCERKFCC